MELAYENEDLEYNNNKDYAAVEAPLPPSPSSSSSNTTMMPILKILDEKVSERHLTFSICNINVPFANALRRTLLSGVPTMAFDKVRIECNDSVISDQQIAERISFIPIPSQRCDRMVYERDCDCEKGCSECCFAYSLDLYNTGAEVLKVTERDLKPLLVNHHNDTQEEAAVLLGGSQLERELVILQLAQGQRLKLKAYAHKGYGMSRKYFGTSNNNSNKKGRGGHVKWSPTTIAHFHKRPVVKLDQRQLKTWTASEKKKLVASCPTNVMAYNAENDTIDIEAMGKCTLCQECIRCGILELHQPNQTFLELSEIEDEFIFELQTTLAYTPKEVLHLALKVMRENLKTCGILLQRLLL